MELPIEFKKRADQLDFDKSERGAYLIGVADTLNAVEAELKYLKSISSYGRIYADDLLKLLQSIKPINS
jgi:hypothetical protein